MKSFILALVCFFCVAPISAQTANMNTNTALRCSLAESIKIELEANLCEESINDFLQQQKTEEIVKDICIYAEIFETWAKQPILALQKREDIEVVKELTSREIRMQKVEQYRKMWNDGTEPITRCGGIIRLEIIEITNRREVKVMPCLERIARTKFPAFNNAATYSHIKSQYQNLAADAWMMLSAPEGLTDDEKKVWLINFMANEKGKGQGGKEWAVEAAERMIKRIDDPSKAILAP